MKYVIAIALAAVACLSAYLFAMGVSFLTTPPDKQGREITLTIEPGASFDAATRELADKGLVSDPRLFRLLGTLTGAHTRIKAGEYAIDSGLTPMQLLRRLIEGHTMLHKLVVPEGLNWRQTAELVEQAGLGSRESFERAVFDPALLAEFQIPATSAEGYLFPETYFLPKPRDNDASGAVRAMIVEFFRQADQLFAGQPPEPGKLHDIVILASLVEKETAAPDERPRVAGVYANRLKKGIRLQADPTVIYGLGAAFDGNLTRAHLEDDSNPYNTYRRGGLPPGPIASPGRGAIEAAANPEAHAYLYFVSKRDGTHHFSRTLSEHNQAVRAYQLRRR